MFWIKKSTSQVLPLNAEGIDRCSEFLEEKLQGIQMERQNRLRIRFSVEESLLRMRGRFGEDAFFCLKTEERFGRMLVRIEQEGDVYNPLNKTEAFIEDWSGPLLTQVGLAPTYAYSAGKNILRLSLPGKSMNPALKMLIAVAVGILLGLLLRASVSEPVRRILTDGILDPVYAFWIRVLTVCSGPIIFLMVCSSVLSSGTIAEEGGSTRRMVMRYFLLSMLAALIAVLVSGTYFRRSVLFGTAAWLDTGDYFEALLSIMPSDVFSPLMESNTPQILLLAFVIGYAVLLVGPRASSLKRLIHQGNLAGLEITEMVSRLVPYFALLMVVKEIVDDELRTFIGMWSLLILGIIASALYILCVARYVSVRKQVPVKKLLKKMFPAFEAVIKTGRMDAGYGQMEQILTGKLGVGNHFTTMALPSGTVLYMPVNVIGTLLFTMYAAMKYHAPVRLAWLVLAMILSVILFVATPPVPGANLLAYIMIFAQLKIPQTALIDAMIFDILFGIFAAAANQILLQLELILQADQIGLLDREILRK